MTTTKDAPSTDPFRALIHEWFVEYNPTYLLSAALVLAGLTLVSFNLAESDASAGIGLTCVAEIYALALIGGAALLCRFGQRRAAVMVGLLAALYQCDLTLHVETCAFLDGVGWIAALAWALFFHAKLRALVAALDLTPSRSALLVPTLGAFGLALVPHALRSLDSAPRVVLVSLFVFAMLASTFWTSRRIESAIGYDYRGRRAMTGTWLMWGGALLAHVGYWMVSFRISPALMIPVAILLSTRWAASERGVWARVLFTLALVCVGRPELLPATAAMASVVLALRAWRSPRTTRMQIDPPSAPAPYRGAPEEPAPEIVTSLPETTFVTAEPSSAERLWLGAASSAHLGVWSALGVGGLWRPHLLWLDLGLLALCVVVYWLGRRAQALVPLAPLGAHLAIASAWITAPRSLAETGVWSIALGFGLLGGSLAVSGWMHRARERSAEPGS